MHHRQFCNKNNFQILDFTNCVYQGVNYCHGGSDLLSSHSSVDQSDFCLSFVFTFQDLKDGYLGMAFTASSKHGKQFLDVFTNFHWLRLIKEHNLRSFSKVNWRFVSYYTMCLEVQSKAACCCCTYVHKK